MDLLESRLGFVVPPRFNAVDNDNCTAQKVVPDPVIPVLEFIDNGSGSKGKNAPPPDEFGFSINFVGAIADPSFARNTLNGGNIDVKSSGGTTPTSDGGGSGGKGKR